MTRLRRQRPYVSTTCLQGVEYAETVRRYDTAGIDRIELGYCSDSTVDLDHLIRATEADIIAHNYFRSVEDEFVLNLASQDDDIRRRSVAYVRNGIDICARHGIDSYTFHAGFRVDPGIDFQFTADAVPDADTCLELFIDSLQKILPYADQKEVSVAIENNVVEERHVIDGSPVVLLSNPGEFEALLHRVNVGVLLDVGHLSVAAETLDFSCEQFLEVIEPSLAALHLHTNDGRADNHDPIDQTDWAFDVWDRYRVPATIEAHFEDVSAIKKQLQTFVTS